MFHIELKGKKDLPLEHFRKQFTKLTILQYHLQLTGDLGIDAAAAAKYKISDMFSKVVDECLQLHGGYGFMLEYPIARAYIDNRANRIYAGTNEIMKELISRTL